jgi:hypothetical protein
MSEAAIRVEGLGKRYAIGGGITDWHPTLRDVIAERLDARSRGSQVAPVVPRASARWKSFGRFAT